MRNPSNGVLVGLISTILVAISTLMHHHSEICCMYGANKYYGWPNAYISLSKTTDNYEEASKVETKDVAYLINNGWEIRFATDYMEQYGLTSSPAINLLLNYLTFGVPVYLIKEKYWKTAKTKEDLK